MDDSLVVNTFSALAQASLLQVFRLLVRKNSDGLAAGDIAHQLGYHTTLCRHIWLFWPEPDCSGRPDRDAPSSTVSTPEEFAIC